MKKIKYFTASWCSPCRVLKPIMTEISNEGYHIEFIDIDGNQQLAASNGVRSVPTCIVEENGNEITRFSGIMSKEDIKRYLS